MSMVLLSLFTRLIYHLPDSADSFVISEHYSKIQPLLCCCFLIHSRRANRAWEYTEKSGRETAAGTKHSQGSAENRKLCWKQPLDVTNVGVTNW